jgi:hypothetical protein
MAHNHTNFDVGNATAIEKAALDLALSYLDRSPEANAIIQQAVDAHVIIKIVHNSVNEYDPDTNTITWDPGSALTIKTSGIGSVGVRSSAVILLHEAAHATDPDVRNNLLIPDPQYGNAAERYAAGKENLVSSYLGEPQRFNHDGQYLRESNPTEHTTVAFDGTVKWVQSD